MSTLSGVLLDVSASMRESIRPGDREATPWVHSIFKVIDNLIKHDVSSSNRTFSIGVGASCGSGTFDILETIRTLKQSEAYDAYGQFVGMFSAVDSAMSILEKNGAPFIRKWANVSDIIRTISYQEALMLFKRLKTDPRFLQSFVSDCLPSACREAESPTMGYFVGQEKLNSAKSRAADAYIKLTGKKAEVEDTLEVIKKAKGLMLVEVSRKSIVSVKEASAILHDGCLNEEKLTNDKVSELLQSVEPFIYGRTPLFTALEQATDLLTDPEFQDQRKLLFVLSDGDPTDEKKMVLLRLRRAGVFIVCCYITNDNIVEPKRLYSSEQKTWDDAARFMFRLSSPVPTQLLPRTIFIKRGWQIDIENNETRLFVQVNHPDVIDDVCDLARNVVCCQDALADVLSSVSLDLYINQCNTSFSAKAQRGGTCFANASAAVLHLAMQRIVGRDGGYPEFSSLRDDMIQEYGRHGANTLHVLTEVCPRYRLHCRDVDTNGALRAIAAKRPLVARFRLTDDEWTEFSRFFMNNPTGVLTKNDIDINRRPNGAETSGHAIVLTSFNSECLRLMNSWGTGWADMGFFRIRDSDVLGLELFDVFWTLDDLSETEKENYERYGEEKAAELVNSLRGLKLAEYECPLCEQSSLVTEFAGKMLQAVCPKCRGEFSCCDKGNILALNMYLTSLGR